MGRPRRTRPRAAQKNLFRRQHNLTDNFIVMYSGNLGLGHDITTMLAAIETLHASTDPRDQLTRFVFIGGGKRMTEIRRAIEAKNLTNTLLLDYQPREQLADTLSAADVHLITQASGTSGLIVPSKFYGILAAGRPSIYIGPGDTEVACVIAETGFGRVLNIGDAGGLVSAIREMANTRRDFETPARDLLRANYSRAINTEKLTQMLQALDTPGNP